MISKSYMGTHALLTNKGSETTRAKEPQGRSLRPNLRCDDAGGGHPTWNLRTAGAVCIAAVLLALASSVTVFASEPLQASELATRGDGTAFVFGAAGDFDGPGGSDVLALAQRLNTGGGAFLLALGDLGYTSDEPGWCASIKSAFNDVVLVAGNHDTGEDSGGDIAEYIVSCPFTLGLPITGGPGVPDGGYGREFYFDYPGANSLARIIMITAGVGGSTSYDYSAGSPHYRWVVDAVNDARSRDIPWVIVGMHKQCITVGSKPSCSMGQDMFDVLVDLKVDLILQAHDHTYQRSKQLGLGPNCGSVPSADRFDGDCVADHGEDDHYTRGRGSVIVVSGAGGRSHYSVDLGGGDAEIGYFVHVMGGNENTRRLGAGIGSVRFTVAADEVVAETDFCPPGGADIDGDCASSRNATFHDRFVISTETEARPEIPTWDISGWIWFPISIALVAVIGMGLVTVRHRRRKA